MDSNLEIVQRLLELSKNERCFSNDVYSVDFKKEHIFLSNILNYALVNAEREFNEKFKMCVNQYKGNLKNSKDGFGWFHSPENLIYQNAYINQIKYAIYGDRFIHVYSFKKELGKEAYKDLILQIDATVLMTPKELAAHQKRCNELAKEIIDEMLAEEKLANNKK